MHWQEARHPAADLKQVDRLVKSSETIEDRRDRKVACCLTWVVVAVIVEDTAGGRSASHGPGRDQRNRRLGAGEVAVAEMGGWENIESGRGVIGVELDEGIESFDLLNARWMPRWKKPKKRMRRWGVACKSRQ